MRGAGCEVRVAGLWAWRIEHMEERMGQLNSEVGMRKSER